VYARWLTQADAVMVLRVCVQIIIIDSKQLTASNLSTLQVVAAVSGHVKRMPPRVLQSIKLMIHSVNHVIVF
jgi:hypothetical protein